jgi:hypothetical protein
VQTREAGAVTTPLQAVLTPGNIVETNKNFSIFQCKEYNIADLPPEFGGNSGCGLWRAYLRKHDDGSIEIIDDVLSGIISYQLPHVPTRLLCQGIGRILLVLGEAQKRWPLL